MTLVGMNYTVNSNGIKNTTIYVCEDFKPYYSNAEAGRGCVGQKTEAIYVGNYDCSNLKPGMEIEAYYDKAISTKSGNCYQPIKRIAILKPNN